MQAVQAMGTGGREIWHGTKPEVMTFSVGALEWKAKRGSRENKVEGHTLYTREIEVFTF